jgi:hypothetical protein
MGSRAAGENNKKNERFHGAHHADFAAVGKRGASWSL